MALNEIREKTLVLFVRAEDAEVSRRRWNEQACDGPVRGKAGETSIAKVMTGRSPRAFLRPVPLAMRSLYRR
jgi:hypothetical protein